MKYCPTNHLDKIYAAWSHNIQKYFIEVSLLMCYYNLAKIYNINLVKICIVLNAGKTLKQIKS